MSDETLSDIVDEWWNTVILLMSDGTLCDIAGEWWNTWLNDSVGEWWNTLWYCWWVINTLWYCWWVMEHFVILLQGVKNACRVWPTVHLCIQNLFTPVELWFVISSCVTLITGAWTPKIQNANEWLQIDLGKQYIITKLHTQGRRGSDEYVMEFFLEFSDDGTTWKRYTNRYGIAEVINTVLGRFLIQYIFSFLSFVSKLTVLGHQDLDLLELYKDL